MSVIYDLASDGAAAFLLVIVVALIGVGLIELAIWFGSVILRQLGMGRLSQGQRENNVEHKAGTARRQ